MKESTELLYREEWVKRVGKLQPGEVLPEVPGLIKHVTAEISFAKEPDPETGMKDITFIISTGVQDRDDDIINVDGWDLDNYEKNPVVLWGHNYGGLPVAQAMEVEVKDDKLIAVDRFTPQDMYPFGYMVYQLVRGKFLRATSVGFRPRSYLWNDDHKGYDFNEQELLEHSIVPVPSNPEALEAASACGIDLAPMKQWAEEILDGGPDGESVALWLPKNAVENIHSALSHVVVSLTDTSTGKGVALDTDEPGSQTEADPPTGTSKVGDLKIKLKLEADMELSEAIQALSDVVRELNKSVDKLPEEIATKVADSVAEKLAESGKEKDPPEGDDELSEADVKEIVAGAVESVLTSKTGKLPE